MDKRFRRVQWGPGNTRSRTGEANWGKPRAWNSEQWVECSECGRRGPLRQWRLASRDGGPPLVSQCECGAIRSSRATRRRVFCASLADVFDNEAPAEWRADLFALIGATPNLDWILLTKRIGNVARMVNEAARTTLCLNRPHSSALPRNAWLGITVANQQEADRDIPKLLAVPAAVRFLSVEPMLGPVDLERIERSDGWFVDTLRGIYTRHHDEGYDHPASIEEHGDGPRLSWVICGGESGRGARPMNPDWVRSLRDQCAAAGVPFFFKQWGGKSAGGDALLDGAEHKRWPSTQTPAPRAGEEFGE